MLFSTILGFVACVGDAAPAVQVGNFWKVAPVAAPVPFLQVDGSPETVVEASGVEPIGDGTHILVLHDKAPELRVYERASRKPIGVGLTSPDFPSGLEVGPKWEGIAQDGDHTYYVIGSHSGKDDGERGQRAYLLQFRLAGDGSAGKPLAIQPGSVKRWNLGHGLIDALVAEGLPEKRVGARKIEGLAVREQRDQAGALTSRILAIGLREPDDLVRVFEVDITKAPEPGATLNLRRAFAFAAGKSVDGLENLQLTSLERINTGPQTGYLVVTASEDKENVFHGNKLWFISDEDIAGATAKGLVKPQELWSFEPKLKAEGVAVLPGSKDGDTSLVVVYDNDAKKTKTPSQIQHIHLQYQPAAR